MIGEIYVIRSPRAFDNPSKACRSGSQAATAGADGILHAKVFNAEMLPYMYLRASVLSITRSRSFSFGNIWRPCCRQKRSPNLQMDVEGSGRAEITALVRVRLFSLSYSELQGHRGLILSTNEDEPWG
jgi:hypothetical protein